MAYLASMKTFKTLEFGTGVTMDLKVDEAEPENSVDKYAVEVICVEGKDTADFYVPPHWHKNHTERMTVYEGRMEVVLNGKKMILKAGDAPVLIPPRAVHSLKAFKGERLVFTEQAMPGGSYKAEFFNDMLQIKFGQNPALLLRSFYDGDTYLALPLYFQIFDVMFITVAGGIAHLFSPPKPSKF